ncbi:MAG: guanylate kinase [Deltaproteobacteria bacterium]|nr:guanylate kinase [Deltaproteobacteria bacterium]
MNCLKNPKTRPGRIYIFSAPSGAGKTTLCAAVRRHFPDLSYSISYTTRSPRKGEEEGVDYFFISVDEFKTGIQTNRWAEWAEVHGNYYGTCAAVIDAHIACGGDLLLDIDVQGTRQILKKYPRCITIFIMPPTLEALRERLEFRGTETRALIEKRIANAKAEMDLKYLYRHLIINDELSVAVDEVTAIIEGYRNRKSDGVA